MFCPKCGTQAEIDAAFCMRCGKSLDSSVAQPQPHKPDLVKQLTAEHSNSKELISLGVGHLFSGALCIWLSRDPSGWVTGRVSRNLAEMIENFAAWLWLLSLVFIIAGVTFIYNHNKPENKMWIIAEQIGVIVFTLVFAYMAWEITQYPNLQGGGWFWLYVLWPIPEIIYIYRIAKLDEPSAPSTSFRENWVCKSCGTTNSAFYNACDKCKVIRDTGAVNLSHNDWKCKKCNFRNSAISATCGHCGMGKTDWLCPKCGYVNSASDGTCAQCVINASVEIEKTDDVWICQKCNTVNALNDDNCATCGTNIYGAYI